MLGICTCLPCYIPDRWSWNANWIWTDRAFGSIHKRSGNEIKNIHTPPREGFFSSRSPSSPHIPVEIQVLIHIFLSKIWLLRHPAPQPHPSPVGIPTTPPWTEDGHFLGPQFVSFEISYTYKRFPAKYVGIETEPVLRDVQSAMH